MKIRSVPRPTQVPCSCGGTLAPARRFEAARTLDVLCCFSCGHEDPPLYGPRATPTASYCRYCDERFTPDDPRERYCSDDCAQRADRIAVERKRVGQQMRIATRRSA